MVNEVSGDQQDASADGDCGFSKPGQDCISKNRRS